MKKMTQLAGTAALALLLAACQNAENETADPNADPSDENSQDEAASEDSYSPQTDDANEESATDQEPADESRDDSGEEDSSSYSETLMPTAYLIESYIYSAKTEFITAFTITRDDEQDLSAAESLERSLSDNDPSEQEILNTFTELDAEGTQLQVNFQEEGNQLSTTSAQTTLFYDALFGISDLYGIKEITFLNPQGEQNITVAQRLVDKPLVIDEERDPSRGYFTIYDSDSQQTFFLPAGALGEQVANDSGEPLSFQETIEAMHTTENEHAFYSSAMVEGLEVVSASLEDGVATVQYTMDDENLTEDDRTVFENAIQLAALDFEAREVRVVNDTAQEMLTYPLLDQ